MDRPRVVVPRRAGRAVAAAGGHCVVDNPIDAGSPLMIMTLGAKQGTEVTVSSDDEAVLARIADMVATDLDAE